MEKRLIAFLVLSTLLIFAWMQMAVWMNPPRPQPPVAVEDGAVEEPAAKPDAPEAAKTETEAPKRADKAAAKEPAAEVEARPRPPQRWLTLGSIDPESPYRLLVTLTNRGAAIERIELNHPDYRDLDETSGYLGHLAPSNEPDGGVRVNVVGPGTPAALAQPVSASIGPGLQVGDVIVAADETPIATLADLADFLGESLPGQEYKPEHGKKPGQKIELTVRRQVGAEVRELPFTVTLSKRPMQIVQPEWTNPQDLSTRQDPSFLLTLESVGRKSIGARGEEIAGLPSLYHEPWDVEEIENGVEFRFRLNETEMARLGGGGPLEIVKRYRLVPAPADAPRTTTGYHLDFDIEIHNLGQEEQTVAYRLNGPNGLPLEGWWYINKIHPKMFQSAGARDVIWKRLGYNYTVFGAPWIVKQYEKEQPRPALFTAQGAGGDLIEMGNAGVDTQYFAASLIPARDDKEDAAADRYAYQAGWAVALGDLDRQDASRHKTTNVSFRLASTPKEIAPGEKYRESFTLFAGPKHPTIMAAYGLSEYIEYGWFWWVARPMVWLLHFFESFLFNYGLAIVLLTVLVRGAMFPLGRKAAMNAKKMQELAPEMKAIAEKYKDDMQKRAEAQQALFRKHNYNPFGGCFLLFLQLPVFLGLYRGLSQDIELRGAPLIPGLEWCSNLAGPDMFWYWEPYLWGFFADPARGWLGPYLNLLPIVTIILFLVHQKLFMPPATDDQTRMQQQVMTFMMVFMGVMFFRVPAGLCVYFIVSSVWGIFERTVLLPKSPPPGAPGAAPAASQGEAQGTKEKKSLFGLGGNGASKPLTPQERRKQRQKRR